jgi:protein-S-isoprenylcysteine O-methyltransferase Ste14
MGLRRQLRAIALLPGIVLVVVPAFLIYATRDLDLGWALPSPWSVVPSVAGALFMVLGLSLMVRTTRLIVSVGHGTIAPWDPTMRLVVRGPYRHVRNPMISGVLFALLGEGLLLGSVVLLGWLAGFALLNMIWIPLVEERGLARRFGDDYVLYKANVPRWIPRLTPWQPPWERSTSSQQ